MFWAVPHNYWLHISASPCSQTAHWNGGVAEILFLWTTYFWNCYKKAGKGRGQQAGPSSPAVSLLTLLRHQSLCFPNALTWHWATPRVEALGDQTYLKMRFRDLVQILAVHCTATGRAFSCKIMNTIAISHLQSPCWSPLFFQYLALLNWLPSLRPSTGKCFCMCLKPSDFNGRQARASVFYWLGCSDECIPFPPVLFCTKFCTFIINYLV